MLGDTDFSRMSDRVPWLAGRATLISHVCQIEFHGLQVALYRAYVRCSRALTGSRMPQLGCQYLREQWEEEEE